MNKIKGITLIEVLTAVLLFSVIAALAIPSFKETIEENRLKNAGEVLFNDLKLSRSDALKRGVDIHTSIIPGASWCYGLNDFSACNCATVNDCDLEGVEKVMSVLDFPGVEMGTTAITGNDIQFEGVRGMSNQDGRITLTLNGKSMTITVNRMGSIHICSDNVLGYGGC